MPYGFTEEGVAMLSGVLSSDRAIDVHVRIIRIFAKLREMLLTNKDILVKIEQEEKKMMQQDGKMNQYEKDIQIIFQALKKLRNTTQKPRQRIGFKPDDT